VNRPPKKDPTTTTTTLTRSRSTLPLRSGVSMSDRTLRVIKREGKDEEPQAANIPASESQRERPSNLRQRVRAPQTYDPSCGRIKMEDVEEVKSEDEDIFYVKQWQEKKHPVRCTKRSELTLPHDRETVGESDTT